MSVPSPSDFQRYDPVLAQPGPDEAALSAELDEVLLSISRKTWEDEGQGLRAVHAKSHGLLSAVVEVPAGLAPELAQGLFAQPGRYDAVMRLSTTPGDLLADRVSTPRGVALRICDVPGARLDGGDGPGAQDFIMVNGPQFNAPDGRAFLRSLKLLAKTTDRMDRTKQLISAILRGTERGLEAMGGQSAKLKAMGGEPPHHILGETFFAQLPLRHGAHIAKLQLVPVSASLRALTDARLDLSDDDALREAVVAFFAGQGAEWELRAQLCTSLEEMPVDDATARWDEARSPFRTVARVIAPPQPAWSPERSAAIDAGMGFSPWHGLQAHRPLGELMRLRRSAYAASQAFRARKNGVALHTGCPFGHAARDRAG
ncbi:catalase family protein [Luteimonas sp. FCS-9]|uniref:catalase family protein n=1 Tax=Luteimonas sp. FCS-9 TaxID=1547516 RepID=UPI00063E79B6|nr:catalase family protein [Luteimonas sp. FCS-9]KLI98718.1 catalase [Luteimonas sp. FCS-9]